MRLFFFKIFKTDAHAENCHGRADSMQFAFFVCVDDALIYVVLGVFFNNNIYTRDERRQIATGQVLCCVCGHFKFFGF
jgi:hypothetical protein